MLNKNINEEKKIRVAIYARVSTEHEAQISALENQIQYYDNILKNNPDWILVERYVDKGITGTSMAKRDAFMRMIKDANEGMFDLIVTREVSRFARNTAETLIQVRELAQKKVGVYFVADNINTLDPNDDYELRLTIMASLAQNESRKISSRVKAGQKISFENGVFYGNGNILGYDKQGRNMIINPEQAETVQYIFKLYAQGKGLRTIQFILEQEGYKTSTGKTNWNPQVIRRVLQNKFYCGYIEYRKEFVPDYLVQKKVRNNGEVEKVIVKGTHEPIISEEEFEKVQSILNGKRRVIDGKNVGHKIPEDVFCRKLKCVCGRTFNKRKTYTTKTGEEHYIYQCYHQLRHGTETTRKNKGLTTEDCCTSMSIPNWKLDIAADWIFRRFFDNKQAIFEQTMGMLEEALLISSNVDEFRAKVEACRKNIVKMYDKYDALVELYMEGDISKEMYLQKKERLEADIEVGKRDLEKQEKDFQEAQDMNNIAERKNKIAEFLTVKAYEGKSPIPRELIEYYVDEIIVDSERMTWRIKFPEGTKSLNACDAKKGENKDFIPVTPPENYVVCTTQYKRQLQISKKTLIYKGFSICR